jgi:outer membrane protein insertion porin family
MDLQMKFILLFLLLTTQAWTQVLNLQDVTVVCDKSDLCQERRARFENMKGEFRSLVHFKDVLKLTASDGGYQYFHYELYKHETNYALKIFFQMKPILTEINVGFSDQNLQLDPTTLLTLREGEFFESQKLKSNLESLQKKLEAFGFPMNSHKADVFEDGGKVKLNVVITLGKPIIFKRIRTNSTSIFVNQFLNKKFNRLYNRPFELNRFKVLLDEAHRDLFEYGYYLVNLDFTPVIKGNRVTLDIKVSHDEPYAFDFKNLKLDDHGTMLNLMRDLFRKFKKPLTEVAIKSTIQEHYQQKAILDSHVDLKTEKYLNKYKEQVTLYKLMFSEGIKTRLTDVTFSGNKFFSQSKIMEMYRDQAFELASIGFYDKEFLEFFVGYLKTKYIEAGYVQVRIQGPIKTLSLDLTEAKVEYSIQEGQRAYLRSIRTEGIPSDLEEGVLAKLKSKIGEPFNPIVFAEDIKIIPQSLQDSGYYFADLTNANEDNIVTYSKTGSDVDVFMKVNPGPIIKLNRIIILGNNKTKKRVIMKKIPLQKDDFITPNKTRDIEGAISATGLFNSVTVSPQRHNSKNASTDLIVRLVERDYGLVEVAPGYRTDLGLKLTGTASYLNIGGANRSLTLRGQVNQRINYQTFDPRRRKERKQFIEFNNSLIYNQGDILDTMIDSSSSVSWQRRRFYAFDADIIRGNTTFTRDLSKQLSSSLRYQIERITQSDATELRDNGSFTIGAITPSLTYDLRNSQTLPVKGAFFNISTEFANPYFLSQNTKDLEVNFYKLVSRNRFYIPFKNGTVAISLVAGVQQNLATKLVKNPDGTPVTVQETNSNGQVVDTIKRTKGYIPNIKVFRLTGMDIVRGFNDEEINRLPDGRDITQARVQDKAFLANFKLEPRYFINDSLMSGVFFDAGRVFIDQVQLNELRSSVGITFKILTPVGTLDFDYGIKLLRKRNQDGTLESPGRFHVSIGFF